MQTVIPPESPTRRRNVIRNPISPNTPTKKSATLVGSPLRSKPSPQRFYSPKSNVRTIPHGVSPYSSVNRKRVLPFSPFQETAEASQTKSRPILRWAEFLVGLTFVSLVIVPYVAQTRLLRMAPNGVDPNPVPVTNHALDERKLGHTVIQQTASILASPGGAEIGGTAQNEPEEVASQQAGNTTATHRFAYTYVIGGCKPEDPSYRNYLNDIMISTYVQREEGSKADVVVFIQMAFESEFDALTEEDIRLLDDMHIRILYIPKAQDESFYRIMLDKFRVLSLTEYERVIFMDGDVMAVGNLDYLFELSVAGVLKDNLVFAGVTEPANGGFFMLKPQKGAADRIHEIIKGKEDRGAALPYPHWDPSVGWGHKIEDGDHWQFLNKRGEKQKWDFYGSFADQGLLFHWVKYEQKSVSIVFRKEVEHWAADSEGKVKLEGKFGLDIFGDRIKHKCWVGTMKLKPCQAPHSDFVHFTGKKKPWLAGPPANLSNETRMETAAHFWFHTLSLLNDKMQIGLDFSNWRKFHRPFLGMFPQHQHAAKTTYKSN